MPSIKVAVSHIGKIQKKGTGVKDVYSRIWEEYLMKFRAKLAETLRVADARFGDNGKRAAGKKIRSYNEDNELPTETQVTVVNPNTAEEVKKAFGGGFLSPDFIPVDRGYEIPNPEEERWNLNLTLGNKAWAVLEDSTGNIQAPLRVNGDAVLEILEGIGAAIEGWDSKVCPKGDELAEDFHELAKEVALAPKAKKLLSEARKQNPDANMYDAVKPLYVYDHEKDRWIKNKE